MPCRSVPLSYKLARLVLFSSTKLGLLIWVFNIIIFPQPHLLLLLRWNVLNPYLLRLGLHELPDISRIPELRSHTKIFTATHKGVGFASFGGSWNAFGGEIVLLAASDGY